MKTKADAPAFPNDRYGSNGMTMRDYLIAHAPTEIPKWFKHKPAKQKEIAEKPTFESANLTPEEVGEYQRYQADELQLHELSPKVKAFAEAQNNYWAEVREANEDFKYRNEAERFVQWRYFYADLILNHPE